jgi:hypothetical protein
MTQVLVAIHHPDDYDPIAAEDDAMHPRDIDLLNEEMIAAGVRVFAGGLHPARSAKSLRAQSHGAVLITDGRTWRPRSTLAVFGYHHECRIQVDWLFSSCRHLHDPQPRTPAGWYAHGSA